MSRLRFRRLLDKAGTVLLYTCLLLTLVPLASILFLVASRGLQHIDLGFFLNRPAPVGETGGGMGNAIVGTIQIVGMAAVMAIPIGVLAGVYIAEYPKTRLSRSARYMTEVLIGVPSIVAGIVAWGLIVRPMGSFSAFAGSVALAFLAVPTITRMTEEFVRMVPMSLREASLALGAPRWRTTLFVVLPAARAGLMTGILLAIARISGETAPLLFTALGNQFWNLRPDRPTASLPVQIFSFAISPYEDWHAQAWAGALVLTAGVAFANLVTRMFSRAPRLQG